MDCYLVRSFEKNGVKRYLVLDVVVDVGSGRANFQAFKDDGSCFPFPLFSELAISDPELLDDFLMGGLDFVKQREGWDGDGSDENLSSLIFNPFLLATIKEHCRSEMLASEIEKLFNR